MNAGKAVSRTGPAPARAQGPVSYDRNVEITERPTETLITLTPVAASKVRELMAEEPDGDTLVLRVAIQGGGCSGFQYGLGFDTATRSRPPTCRAPRSTT
jgi:hypothetical protein